MLAWSSFLRSVQDVTKVIVALGDYSSSFGKKYFVTAVAIEITRHCLDGGVYKSEGVCTLIRGHNASFLRCLQ